jgi:glutamyl-tRNA reductase
VAIREHLAFDSDSLHRALEEINARFDFEAVILSTCNRVELYLGRPGSGQDLDPNLLAEFMSEFHHVPLNDLKTHLYHHANQEAVHHLFRVAASLDSMILGEGQIAGQVRTAYEMAHNAATVGPLLHALFQHANHVAGRVRTETGIGRGHVSIASVAIDYVRQVFEHFGDKTVVVIGAGKMGELTLRHLRKLHPERILVANRSAAKAQELASSCGGTALAWDQLDDALARADIVLSTTGAPEPIVSRERFQTVLARRPSSPLVILDIAVPRDFDPSIHDGERVCVFNIDDLERIRQHTLAQRGKHARQAEEIAQQESASFLTAWKRRRNSGVIARLNDDFEAKRKAIVHQLLGRMNGRLTDADREYIEGAFRLLQNQFLHGPITALMEEPPEVQGHSLLEALRKLFRLEE